MKQTFLFISILTLILCSAAGAKLPPNVQDIFPKDQATISVTNEFWLYGPTLGSYDKDQIILKDENNTPVECDLTVHQADDYTDFEFDADFRGVSGDSGELELLIVKPKALLEAEKTYVLTTKTLSAEYRTSSAEPTEGPETPTLLQAEMSAPRGYHFGGERLYSIKLSFTLPDPNFVGRLEILDGKSGQVLAFALPSAFIYNDDHLEVTTRADSTRLKIRLVDHRGQIGEPSAEVSVGTGARNRSYATRFLVLALFGIIIFKLVSSRSK